MARAETRFGAHKDVDSLAFIWVGAGIGADLVLDGRPYRGTHGMIVLGHLPVAPGGPRCVCGNIGCLETVASVPVLERTVAEAATSSVGLRRRLRTEKPIDALAAQVRAGDRTARGVLEDFVEYLAAAAASLVNLLNPRVIVLGGLMTNAADVFIEPLVRALRSHVFPLLREDMNVVVPSFGAHSEVVGAAAIALDRFLYEPPPRAERISTVSASNRSKR